MSGKMYCTNCGTELSQSQIEMLKKGETVYCTECGMGFQAEKQQPTSNKPNIIGGFKKFGEKLGKEIKKTAEKVETKVKEKREKKKAAEQPQNQPYSASPPQPQYNQNNYQYSDQGSSNSGYQASPSAAPASGFGSNFKRGLKKFYARMQPLTPEELEERNLRLQAERNVMQRQFFSMHLLTFILIDALIFGINWVTNNQNLWSLYVVTGWGLLMAIHAFRYTDSRLSKPIGFFGRSVFYYLVVVGYLIFLDTFDGRGFSSPMVFSLNVAIVWGGFLIILLIFDLYWKSESVKRQMAQSNKPDHLKRPVVVSHILAYLIFNAIAFGVDYFLPMTEKWYYWTIFGWGIFVVLHILWSALYGVIELSTSGALLLAHVISYVTVCSLLILINTYTGVDFSNLLTWSLFPITFWGVFVILHFIVHIVFLRRPAQQDIEKEMERLRAQKQK